MSAAERSELWALGAAQIVRLIAAREVSALEVVESHLKRIEEINPQLGAVVGVLAEDACAAAVDADEAQSRGRAPGELQAVPFTVKENIDLAGSATTDGLRAHTRAPAVADAPMIERLRAAGAIPIARTNLPDIALRFDTDSSLHGRTRNPWCSERTAGGSSGGDAVAVATGMAALGIGNDIGGSLRSPAHCCGVASIKPTPGRVPHARSAPLAPPTLSYQLMMVHGVIARSVADVRTAFAPIVGAHPRDPDSLPLELVGAERANPCRVTVVAEPPGGETHPGIAQAVRDAGRWLAEAGYEVEEGVPPRYEECTELWVGWMGAELRGRMPALREVLGADGLAFLEGTLEAYPPPDLAGYVELFARRRAVLHAWHAFLLKSPLVLSPVWTQTAFPIGDDLRGAQGARGVLELARPVIPGNLLGLPSAVVPIGLVDGMPVGAHVQANRFAEPACLAAAQAIEARVAPLTPIDPRLAADQATGAQLARG